ncbi:MAG: retroviral-like aspartic protease family protein [Treponema sp.]|jgi:hypothetical protein|nr:retroviral-like aspartic protease family protein [Treponema sp.]
MKPQAFTFKEENLLDSIITPISTRQSVVLCRGFKLVCQQANVRALWDTGATGSSISRGLARHLGLEIIDMCQVRGVSGVQPSPVYLVDILLPSNVEISNVRVTEFLDNGNFDILIGMEIITLGDFAISNKDKKTIVSFRTPPSDNPIDFLQEINESSNQNVF